MAAMMATELLTSVATQTCKLTVPPPPITAAIVGTGAATDVASAAAAIDGITLLGVGINMVLVDSKLGM